MTRCAGWTAVISGESLRYLNNEGKGRGKGGRDAKSPFCVAAGESQLLSEIADAVYDLWAASL